MNSENANNSLYSGYMEESSYWLGFSQCPGIGPGRFASLLATFETAENAWKATEKELVAVLKPVMTSQFLDFRKTFSIAEYEEKMQKAKVGFLILEESHYPHHLKQIKNPPFVLFTKGEFLFNSSQNAIGIVGTRKITDYGRQVTEMITQELVAA